MLPTIYQRYVTHFDNKKPQWPKRLQILFLFSVRKLRRNGFVKAYKENQNVRVTKLFKFVERFPFRIMQVRAHFVWPFENTRRIFSTLKFHTAGYLFLRYMISSIDDTIFCFWFQDNATHITCDDRNFKFLLILQKN